MSIKLYETHRDIPSITHLCPQKIFWMCLRAACTSSMKWFSHSTHKARAVVTNTFPPSQDSTQGWAADGPLDHYRKFKRVLFQALRAPCQLLHWVLRSHSLFPTVLIKDYLHYIGTKKNPPKPSRMYRGIGSGNPHLRTTVSYWLSLNETKAPNRKPRSFDASSAYRYGVLHCNSTVRSVMSEYPQYQIT